jgi:hypothetical protein
MDTVKESSQPVINRTGAVYSFSSVQWEVTYPDGFVGYIWSPPWSDLDYDDPQQDAGAMRYVCQLWEKKEHMKTDVE